MLLGMHPLQGVQVICQACSHPLGRTSGFLEMVTTGPGKISFAGSSLYQSEMYFESVDGHSRKKLLEIVSI